jgi:hypothetical protein
MASSRQVHFAAGESSSDAVGSLSVPIDTIYFVPEEPLPEDCFDLALDFVSSKMWPHIDETSYREFSKPSQQLYMPNAAHSIPNSNRPSPH